MPSRITLRTSLRGSLAVAAALAVTGLTGCSSNDMSPMPGMDHGSSGSPAAAGSPAATGTPAAGPHNEADVMFAQAMIPHHRQALEMTALVDDRTTDDRPECDTEARDIAPDSDCHGALGNRDDSCEQSQ